MSSIHWHYTFHGDTADVHSSPDPFSLSVKRSWAWDHTLSNDCEREVVIICTLYLHVPVWWPCIRVVLAPKNWVWPIRFEVLLSNALLAAHADTKSCIGGHASVVIVIFSHSIWTTHCMQGHQTPLSFWLRGVASKTLTRIFTLIDSLYCFLFRT